ncbi:hypothetical protein [Brevibacillus reuszeri]
MREKIIYDIIQLKLQKHFFFDGFLHGHADTVIDEEEVGDWIRI